MPGESHQIAFQRETDVRLEPPSLRLLLGELRALREWAGATRALRRAAAQLPRGNGHAVLVLPGFWTSDRSTAPLREALQALGYRSYGWGFGRNLGMRPAIRTGLREKLRRLAAENGPVSLIGWSLGGVFARELARHQPQDVRRVICLGSPINGRPDANNLNTLFRWATGNKTGGIDWDGFQRRRVPPPVPCTAIYTRSDGIVAWPCCLEEPLANTENIEVRGTHMGLVRNVTVLRHLADRLAQPPPRPNG